MDNLASRIELDASTEEWIKKIQDIYTMEYYSAVKRMKKCHLQQRGQSQRLIIIPTEVNQTKTNIWYGVYGIDKNDTNELILQNRNRFTDIENKLMVTKG